jgi:hypothetical protein
MSFIKSLFIAAFVTSVGVTAALGANAHATSTSCTVTGVQPNIGTPVQDRKFTIAGDTTYIDVKVTGTNCALPVTLAAWEAPNGTDGKPYSEQKLVSHVTKTFKEGTHRMSIKLPNCFYQIDLVRGTNPYGTNNTGAYPKERMIGSIHGGTKECETPPKKIKVCELANKKIITIDEKNFDRAKHSKDLSKCAETPTPGNLNVCDLETREVVTIKETEFDASKYSKDLNDCAEVLGEEAPEVIASTGPEAIIGGLLGSSALGYGAYSYLGSRRQLINKLLGR